MEKRILICIVFSLFISFGSLAQIKTKQRVLFLGNSYTYVNNLPIILKYIAFFENDTIITDENLIGGYTLKAHSTNQNSIAKIMQGNWDAVVLQEQSQLPSFPIEDVESEVFPYAKYLDSLIHVYSPCAKTIFYMTWGRKNGDQSNCSFWPPVCTYQGMDSLLNLRYTMMAQQNHAMLSPVGAIWNEIRQSNPEINLYQSDESHPDLAGSYAAACSFYTSLFGKNPLDISYNYEMDTAITNPIKRACKSRLFDSIYKFDYSLLPLADFGFQIDKKSVSFINNSLNATSYFWDFGDGQTDTGFQVNHTYEKNGNYLVKLKVTKCDKSHIDSAQIVILTSDLNEVNNQNSSFKCFPNPAEQSLTIQFNQVLPESIELMAINGKLIQVITQAEINRFIEIEKQESGLYLLKMNWKDQSNSYSRIQFK
ncbi:MAG: PKD domain-containing protein [Bacteroidia bacterium]